MHINIGFLNTGHFLGHCFDIYGEFECNWTEWTCGDKIYLNHTGLLLFNTLNDTHLPKRQARLWINDFFNFVLNLCF